MLFKEGEKPQVAEPPFLGIPLGWKIAVISSRGEKRVWERGCCDWFYWGAGGREGQREEVGERERRSYLPEFQFLELSGRLLVGLCASRRHRHTRRREMGA